LQPLGVSPGGNDDRVGEEAEDDADGDAPRQGEFEAKLAADDNQLDHHVEDRAGGEREEHYRHGGVDER
jgi:hypothetical protein